MSASLGGNAYNRNKHEFMKAKIQIGNSKGPVTYKLSQNVFHHDDIPESKRLRKQEVQQWVNKSQKIRPDNERPAWQKSTITPIPVCERKQAENFREDRTNPYQYNYRSESVDSLRLTQPIESPNKFRISTQLRSDALDILQLQSTDRIQKGYLQRAGEMPIHPNLEGAKPWNVSTYFERSDLEKDHVKITKKAQTWTKKANQRLDGTLDPKLSKSYTSPMQSSIDFQKEVRRQKKKGTFSLDRHLFIPPTEPVDRKLLKNRLANEKPNKVLVNQHSGVWEINKATGKPMWSDTGSYEFHSKGDVNKSINLDAFNLEGPTSAPPTRKGKQSWLELTATPEKYIEKHLHY